MGSEDEIFYVDSAKESFDELECDDKEFLVVEGARYATFLKEAAANIQDWLQRKF